MAGVRAAARIHPGHPPTSMKVLYLSPGADTGGQGYRLRQAFRKHSKMVEFRSATHSNNYIRYPKDLSAQQARRMYPQFDLIHVNESNQRIPQMPTVIHYHGTRFRNNPGKWLGQQRRSRAAGTVSTLDLWLLAPRDTEWLPSAYDGDWLRTFRQPHDQPVLRVGHAPTDRKIKSTDALIAAVKRLRKEHPVELELIERQRWEDCLRRKGTVDIYFDQVILGYGNNAVEAWGMGIPVICGAQPATLDEMRRRFGTLPFYEATPDTIYDALAALADDQTRAKYAQRGTEHFNEYHAAAGVVAQLERLYKRTVEAYG